MLACGFLWLTNQGFFDIGVLCHFDTVLQSLGGVSQILVNTHGKPYIHEF